MGITKLHAHLKPLSRDVDVAAYAGCSVGVDASAWLHRAYHGARADGAADVEARVAAFFADYAAALAGRDVRAVLVFDGKGPAAKKAVAGAKAPRGDGSPRARGGDAGGAALAAGATMCVQAAGEADAELAARARRGDVCCVLTDDCDLVAMGAPRCLFAAKLATAGDGRPTLVGSEFELRALGASGTFLGWPRERFVAFCVACGCDYAKSVPGVGPARALALSAGAADAGGRPAASCCSASPGGWATAVGGFSARRCACSRPATKSISRRARRRAVEPSHPAAPDGGGGTAAAAIRDSATRNYEPVLEADPSVGTTPAFVAMRLVLPSPRWSGGFGSAEVS